VLSEIPADLDSVGDNEIPVPNPNRVSKLVKDLRDNFILFLLWILDYDGVVNLHEKLTYTSSP